jgi:hypothetical protein
MGIVRSSIEAGLPAEYRAAAEADVASAQAATDRESAAG